jgi:hypothetical protein
MDHKEWEARSQSEKEAFMDECMEYDDVLRENGHIVGMEALEGVENTTTLRFQNGKVSITDGPFAETKEQLGGILILEATDLNHAILLMSKHPGVRSSCFEIRPIADMTEVVRESSVRRHSKINK